MEKDTITDVAVVGSGPAGLTAAIALAAAGLTTCLVGKPGATDNRTTALLGGSVTALEVLDVWRRCRNAAAPLRIMRLVDDTGRLLRAPEVRFDAAEISLEAFGWNIQNTDLVAALVARADELANLHRVQADAQALAFTPDEVQLTTATGLLRAKLVVAADGRNSLCREVAGIAMTRASYPQTALTFNLSHSRPHQNISTEFHTVHGPFTLVPLPGQRSSLVWVVDPAEADDLMVLDDRILAGEVERRSHSILGKISIEPGRGSFPLRIETAQRFAADRLVLVSEAAHVLPPIGAQGLNLGLRDAATIADLAAASADPGAPQVTDDYDRLRQADAGRRKIAINLLNQSLLTDFLPVQGLRGLGLFALDRIGPLRRALMQEGIAPHGLEPALMRGEPVHGRTP